MNVFFEESGAFKTACVLSKAEASLQVCLPSGRRLKLKANQILLSFEQADLDGFMAEAQQVAGGLEPDFLWDCAPTEEFSANAFAREVFGEGVRPVDEAGLMLALHGAPMHFYKKGRGSIGQHPQRRLRLPEPVPQRSNNDRPSRHCSSQNSGLARPQETLPIRPCGCWSHQTNNPLHGRR